MKKNKFFGIILSMFAILVLWGCSDNRESYIEELQELNRTDLIALENWLDENEESLNEYFNIRHQDTNVGGRALSQSQVSELESGAFVRWDFEVDEDLDNLTLTYTWDYTAHITAQLEALDNADLEALNEWFDENASTLNSVFNIHHDYVDAEGETLDYATQVSELSDANFIAWAFEISGDSLTFTQTWNYTSFIRFTAEDLIGFWSAREGDQLESPISGSASTVSLRFLEDGTLIRYSNTGQPSEFDWQILDVGELFAGHNLFTVEGTEDILVITDSRGREVTFRYVPDIDSSAPLSEFEERLIAYWSAREGAQLESPISGNASTVSLEFLENRIFVRHSNTGGTTDFNWQVLNEELGEVLIGTNLFIIEVEGNLITITDNRDREVTFHRISDPISVRGGEIQANNEPEEDEDDDGDDDDDDDDDDNNDGANGSSTNGSSTSGGSPGVSTTNNWRQFLREYDAWMDIYMQNLDDWGMMAEFTEWTGRVLEIQGTLSGSNLITFTEEAVRIGLRPLE